MTDPYSDPTSTCPACGTTCMVSPDECEWGGRLITFAHTCPCGRAYIRRWLREVAGEPRPAIDTSAIPKLPPRSSSRR